MIPDFPFVFLKEGLYIGLICSKLGFRKCEYISSYILHLEEEIDRVSCIVVKANAVNILKVDLHSLFFPYGVWGEALARVNLLEILAVI
jgi:hypothetical protein